MHRNPQTPELKSPAPAGDPYSPAQSTPRLRRLLTAQLGLAQRLDALSQSQSAHLLADDLRAATTELQLRSAIMAELTEHAESIRAIVQSAGGIRQAIAAASPADRPELEDLFASVDAVIAMVQARDAMDEATLKGRRDDVARELSQIAVRQGAGSAYEGPGHLSPTFQDRQG